MSNSSLRKKSTLNRGIFQTIVQPPSVGEASKAAKQRYDLLRNKYDALKSKLAEEKKNFEAELQRVKEESHKLELRAVTAESKLAVLVLPQVPIRSPVATPVHSQNAQLGVDTSFSTF